MLALPGLEYVDRLDRTVGRTKVEVGQDVTAPVQQRALQASQLLEPTRKTTAKPLGQCEQEKFARPRVRILIGGDQRTLDPEDP